MNEYAPHEDRPLPFANTIFIGDGRPMFLVCGS
jgi:hypothetical protein